MRSKSNDDHSFSFRNSSKIYVFILLVIFMGISYYSLTLSWENRSLLDNIVELNERLAHTSRNYADSENMLKQFKQEKDALTRSNNDLQSQINKQSIENKKLLDEKVSLTTKITRANNFYVALKNILGKLDDPQFTDDDEDISETTYVALQSVVKNRLVSDKREIEQIKSERDSCVRENNDLKEQISNLKEENEHLKRESTRRGLQVKQGTSRHGMDTRVDVVTEKEQKEHSHKISHEKHDAVVDNVTERVSKENKSSEMVVTTTEAPIEVISEIPPITENNLATEKTDDAVNATSPPSVNSDNEDTNESMVDEVEANEDNNLENNDN